MPRSQVGFLVAMVVIGCMVGGLARANLAPPGKEYTLGITLEITPDGPRIATIDKTGDGAKAGLEKGDLILAVDRRYAKALSADDLKAFAEEPHVWPMLVLIVRGADRVMEFEIRS